MPNVEENSVLEAEKRPLSVVACKLPVHSDTVLGEKPFGSPKILMRSDTDAAQVLWVVRGALMDSMDQHYEDFEGPYNDHRSTSSPVPCAPSVTAKDHAPLHHRPYRAEAVVEGDCIGDYVDKTICMIRLRVINRVTYETEAHSGRSTYHGDHKQASSDLHPSSADLVHATHSLKNGAEDILVDSMVHG